MMSDQFENMELLKEIFNLKIKLRELYLQTGPANSTYISWKIKLDILIKEYMEEKFTALKSYHHLDEALPEAITL